MACYNEVLVARRALAAPEVGPRRLIVKSHIISGVVAAVLVLLLADSAIAQGGRGSTRYAIGRGGGGRGVGRVSYRPGAFRGYRVRSRSGAGGISSSYLVYRPGANALAQYRYRRMDHSSRRRGLYRRSPVRLTAQQLRGQSGRGYGMQGYARSGSAQSAVATGRSGRRFSSVYEWRRSLMPDETGQHARAVLLWRSQLVPSVERAVDRH